MLCALCASAVAMSCVAQPVGPERARRKKAERPESRLVDRLPRHPEQPVRRTPGVQRRPVLVAGSVGPIELQRVSPAGDRVSLVDLDGNAASVPLHVIGALALPSPIEDASSIGEYSPDDLDLLILNDGQRHTGWLIEGEAPEGTLQWFDPILGDRSFAFDAVQSVELRTPDQIDSLNQPDGVDDALVLANGDRVIGFVSRLDANGAAIETDAGVLNIPIEHVHRVEFGNPPTRQRGPLLCLTSGSAIAFVDWRTTDDDDRVLVTLVDGETTELLAKEIAGICADASFVAPLSTLELRQEIPQQQRWTPEPAHLESPVSWSRLASFGVADLMIPGATRLDLTLPPNAGAMVGVFEIPADSVEWVDCQVTIWAEREPLFETRLYADHPVEPFVISVRGEELILTVQPRQAGATNTSVRLLDPIILCTKHVQKDAP